MVVVDTALFANSESAPFRETRVHVPATLDDQASSSLQSKTLAVEIRPPTPRDSPIAHVALGYH
jgi:hypothetical protein